MRFLLIVIILFCSLLPAKAASGWKSLVVNLREGAPIVLNLSETLAVEVTERSILISDFGVDYELSFADVVSLSHGREAVNNISTGVASVGSDTVSPSISLSGSELHFSGFPSGTPADVYSVSGVKLQSVMLGEDVSLPLSSFSALGDGIYIVNAGGVSLKVNVRP